LKRSSGLEEDPGLEEVPANLKEVPGLAFYPKMEILLLVVV
jgi:hypothetical protein